VNKLPFFHKGCLLFESGDTIVFIPVWLKLELSSQSSEFIVSIQLALLDDYVVPFICELN